MPSARLHFCDPRAYPSISATILACAILQFLSLGWGLILYGWMMWGTLFMNSFVIRRTKNNLIQSWIIWLSHCFCILLFALMPSADDIKWYNAFANIYCILNGIRLPRSDFDPMLGISYDNYRIIGMVLWGSLISLWILFESKPRSRTAPGAPGDEGLVRLKNDPGPSEP